VASPCLPASRATDSGTTVSVRFSGNFPKTEAL
jgi:hypothetical protein